MEEQIDYIMDVFDFEKVHKTMKALKWTWASTHNDGVPSIFEIKQTARKLLKQMALKDEQVDWIATGGFKASKVNGDLELTFYVDRVEGSEVKHILEEERA